MKVVTFNLRCGNDPNGNSIEERAPRLKAVMDRYDADLVGFQEVTPAWMDSFYVFFPHCFFTYFIYLNSFLFSIHHFFIFILFIFHFHTNCQEGSSFCILYILLYSEKVNILILADKDPDC